ncbi:hypothetical protein [Shimia sp.]|uniref:hypothetical protein n=1 Tax=Shimia sp. TaxID=1954381 RepID=UPI003BA9B2C1
MHPAKIAGLTIVGLAGTLAISWFMLDVKGAFMAKEEAIRTKVHAQSQSYVDGMKTELGRIKMEHLKADAAGRIGIENHVRDTYSKVDTSDFPQHLKDFLTQVGVY